MKNISVIIITGNEEENIVDCLQSVSWANEIIIVDSGSSDRTIELSKKFTDKIYHKEWEGFAKQKSYALSLASNEWILSIDADERVTEELHNEIEEVKEKDENGFYIPRKNYFFNKLITSCGWNKDKQLRLFKKSKTKLTDRLVHEGFEVDGKTGELKNSIKHFTYTSLEKYLTKINSYSALQAEELYENKPKVKGHQIILHGIAAFLRYYISLKGFKDGIHGLIISVYHSVSTLLTYVKIWELQRNEKTSQVTNKT